MNWGICDNCRARVRVDHVVREGKAYIRKHCATCGTGECLVSSDAERWLWKRDVCHFVDEGSEHCTLDCDTCRFDHKPRLVFVDVTNRCNLNCPICLANVPGMGFEFNPPLSYFEKLFREIGSWDPRPRVELFGGEPTVREDMFEIIRMARENRLAVSLVTNSIRVADEEYCKKLCEENIDMLLAFDGRDPAVYERMRGTAAAYEKKLKALDNVLKHSRRRHTVVCTVARQLNDQIMADHFQFLHGYRSVIRRLFFIPLAEMWEGEEYETKVMTTPEDVEHIPDDAFGDEKLEFLPLGLFGHFEPAHRFFSKSQVRFSHVHPNCESGAVVISDGKRFRPLSSFLKRPLSDIAADLVNRAHKLNPRLEKLDPRKKSDRLWGQLLCVSAFGRPLLRGLDFREVMKGQPWIGLLRLLAGAVTGKRPKDLLRKHTNLQQSVEVTILPFEEPHSLESARMERCGAMFIYLDPETEQVRTVPFCIWCLYRRDTFLRIAKRWPAKREGAVKVARAVAGL